MMTMNCEFVETIVTKKLSEAFSYAKRESSFVTISGPTGRGKSFTAMAWAAANNAKYLRATSGCTRRAFIGLLAEKIGINTNSASSAALLHRLFGAIKKDDVLIVDEAGFLLPRGSSASCALEVVRDIYDNTGAAVILIFTDVYLKEMKTGLRADYFEQFFGRISYSVEIPFAIFRSEVVNICHNFAPDANERFVSFALESASQRDGKLRTLFEDLKHAAAFAAADKRKLAFLDFKTAVQWRKSGGTWPAEGEGREHVL